MTMFRPRDVAAWAAVGAVAAVGVLGAASIGLFVVPVAAVLGAALARRSVPGQEGLLLGVAVALAAVGLADVLDGVSQCTGLGVSGPPRPGRPSECESGGVSPAVSGGAAAAFALAAVAALRSRTSA